MADDFLATLFGNPQRARILRVFALNQPQPFTAALAAKRSGVGAAVVIREIRALEKMRILKKTKFSIKVGKRKRTVNAKQKEDAWAYDGGSKQAAALLRFVHETSPVQHKRVLTVLRRGGRLSVVILSGGFVGDPSRPADLIIAGEGINESRLEAAIRVLEPEYGREIRYATFTTPEFRYRLTIEDRLIRDTLDYPHLVLLDKAGIL
jgi:hypothetical protein